MAMVRNPYQIDTVDVLSTGEQVAWVLTSSGGYVVSRIPAAGEDARSAGILCRAESLDSAREWFREEYGM